MIPKKLRRFLQQENVSYEVTQGTRKRQDQKAKVAIVKADGKDFMVVLPSTAMLDLLKLSLVLGTETVSLTTAEDIAGLFPDCDPGALPAVGRLYNLPCFVDETLLDGANVVISGGKRKSSIRMTSDEYWRIAQAEIGDFRVHAGTYSSETFSRSR